MLLEVKNLTVSYGSKPTVKEADISLDAGEILSSPFTLVTPDSSNPYKRMYVEN